MRLIGCLLLLSGFAIVLAALGMLHSLAQRFAFAGAGLGVELMGLALLTYGYRTVQIAARPKDWR